MGDRMSVSGAVTGPARATGMSSYQLPPSTHLLLVPELGLHPRVAGGAAARSIPRLRVGRRAAASILPRVRL